MILDWLPTDPFSYPDRDCYWLARFIRNHYGVVSPNFEWTYKLYPTQDKQPKNIALGCLEQCAKPRHDRVKHLDIALFKESISADLGTILELPYESELFIAYMTVQGAVVEPLHRRIHRIVDSYWVVQ